MASILEKAIIRTLIYADVFDHPLTENEIFKYLINIKNQISKIKNTNQKLKIKKTIYEKDGYYFLRGRSFLVKVRKQRERFSHEKLKIAKKVGSIIRFIPSVQLVGVTGALAVNNSKKDDDIDLMIVTKKGLLWTTRLVITLLTELLGVRRRPGDIETNNKICLNMFVDEGHLSVPENERDLFSAHEVVQMKPIYDRNRTYNRFLQANMWVKKYLPNAIKIKNAINSPRGWHPPAGGMTPPMVEGLVKSFQLWYMRNRRTSELISDGIIRFHPHDARIWVMGKYKQKVSSYFLR